MYKQHTLRFDFINKTSAFDDKGNNRISISNIKATVSLNSVVGRGAATAEISLYGLGLERLADLSGRADGIIDSAGGQSLDVEIFADDTKVFAGVMTSSTANMNTPDACLTITASATVELQNKGAAPFSASGPQRIEGVISAICASAGYNAAFNGVSGMVTSGSPHFEGSVFDQLYRICSDYGIAMSVSPPDKIEFWPSSGKRDAVMPFISKDHGLIGYPVFSNGGLMFQTQYSSLLLIGRYIEIKTGLPHADGTYELTSVRHELSSWVSGGSWHSVCVAIRTPEMRSAQRAAQQAEAQKHGA
ncbi:hypothetical protein [Escherichia coli]|uniref:hypothetical protein n=1 Tax=Escherichia coli TaxID=562 RepID=UPI001FCEE611|nr:hypothetical protein [Escherichia coli]